MAYILFLAFFVLFSNYQTVLSANNSSTGPPGPLARGKPSSADTFSRSSLKSQSTDCGLQTYSCSYTVNGVGKSCSRKYNLCKPPKDTCQQALESCIKTQPGCELSNIAGVIYAVCDKYYAPCQPDYHTCEKAAVACEKTAVACEKAAEKYCQKHPFSPKCNQDYSTCNQEYDTCNQDYDECSQDYNACEAAGQTCDNKVDAKCTQEFETAVNKCVKQCH